VLEGESNPDPEIAYRCRQVMNRYYQTHAEEIADRMEPAIGWPWVDSLTLSCTDQNGELLELEWDRKGWNLYDRQRFLEQAQSSANVAVKQYGSGDKQVLQSSGHPWNAWRAATRLWIIELVSQRRDVVYFLRCMCEGHLQQCHHYGYEPRHGLQPQVQQQLRFPMDLPQQ
jgi:hypothetical protein